MGRKLRKSWMIHIDGRPVEYVADFIQNLAPICVCILSVLIFVMKCKPTEMQTKYYSFLLKHFKTMSKLMLLHNCFFKTQSVSSLIILCSKPGTLFIRIWIAEDDSHRVYTKSYALPRTKPSPLASLLWILASRMFHCITNDDSMWQFRFYRVKCTIMYSKWLIMLW